jgi:hypothetical protein
MIMTTLYDLPTDVVTLIMHGLTHNMKVLLGSTCIHFRQAFVNSVHTIKLHRNQLSSLRQNTTLLFPLQHLIIVDDMTGLLDISWLYRYNLRGIQHIKYSGDRELELEYDPDTRLIIPSITMSHMQVFIMIYRKVCYDHIDDVFPNLEKLDINGNNTRIFPVLPKLYKLKMFVARNHVIDMSNIQYAQLRELDTNYDVGPILKWCTGLEKLSGFYKTGDIILPTTLKYINLEADDPETDIGIPSVYECKELTTLILNVGDFYTTIRLPNMPPKLERLKLFGADIKSIATLPHTIKHLNISTYNDLRPLIHAKDLNHLEIRNIPNDKPILNIMRLYANRYGCEIHDSYNYRAIDLECIHPNVSEYIELCYRAFDMCNSL